MNFSKMSFKSKMLFVVGGLSVLAIGQIGFMSFRSMQTIGFDKEKAVSAATEGWLDKIDRNLFERYGDVQAFAMSEPARSGVPDRIVAFMNDMMGAYAPIYDVMMVVNSRGRVVAVNTVAKDGKDLKSDFFYGKDYSKEEWFKKAISGEVQPGAAFVEDLHVDEDVAKVTGGSGKVMSFTAPIRDKTTGKVLGVWTNRMNWTDVVEAITLDDLKKLRAGHEKALAYLVDEKGNYLIHPKGDEYVMKKAWSDFDGFKERVSKTKTPEPFHFNEETPEITGEAVASVALSPGFASYPGKGWYGYLAVPKSDHNLTFAWMMIGLAFLVQVVVSIFGWGFANGLSTKFVEIMKKLGQEAEEVKTSAVTIHGTSQGIADASTAQASSLQETAAAIEEINAMIKKSTENANRSSEVAVKSQEVVQRGKESVERVIQAIEEISNSNQLIMGQVEESNQQITEIVKVITEIGAKTKVINDIVFQTKLLSFNASVEAARAGEHGKGFAVVAEEVGNLAQMSGNAAKEIGEMLNASIQKVEGIVESTKRKVEGLIAEGKQKIESGTVVARECGTILEEVVTNVSEVNQMVSEITTASQEQASGVNEITKAMNQLDHATHENATAARNAANSADSLNQKSEELFEVVTTLKGLVLGGGEAPVVSEAPRNNVVSMKSHKKQTKKASSAAEKLPAKAPLQATGTDPIITSNPKKGVTVAAVAGGAPDVQVPSQNDPRFGEL